VHVYESKQPGRADASADEDADVEILEVGTTICVRNRFIGNWSSGFQVAEVLDDGYRIQRLSDGLTFPDLFAFDDVRIERRHHGERGITGSFLDREPTRSSSARWR
jgi:hypothetical protein